MSSVVETNGLWRPSRPRPPAISTVPDLLAWRVDLDPDAAALKAYGVAELSFGEWQTRARIAAAALKARGVGRGDRVGLLFGPRTWTEFAVAYCATHLIGAVAVPISDRLAAPQIEYVLDHCAVAATVHDDAIDPAVEARWHPVAITELLADPSSTVDDTVATATDLAQILYTSGTTGRTRIRTIDGELTQVASRNGTLKIDVVDCTAELAALPGAPPRPVTNFPLRAVPALAEAAEHLVARLADRPFDYAEDWQVRVGLVVASGRVRHVLLVVSHVVADWYAAEILVRDLRHLLVGRNISKPGRLCPLDLAERERTDVRRTERALVYWRDAYARIPRDPFGPPGPDRNPRYNECLFTSSALLAAVSRLASRHSVSTSTVLLAATAATICAATGESTCGLLTIVNNRHLPGHDEVVAPVNQLGLAVIEAPPSSDLSELIPRAWRAALIAYRFAHYDQAALDRGLRESGRGGEVEVDPYCCFNDIRGNTPITSSMDDDEMVHALSATTVEWLSKPSFNWRFFLEVRPAVSGVCLSLTTDARYLPPERMEAFLRDLERRVVMAALDTVHTGLLRPASPVAGGGSPLAVPPAQPTERPR